MTLSLLLCDDHTLFREGLAPLIACQPGWQVLAQASTAAVPRSADLDRALLTGREREVPRLLAQQWVDYEPSHPVSQGAKCDEDRRISGIVYVVHGHDDCVR